jgi:hypothetical protein
MEPAELQSRITAFIEQGENLNILEFKAFHRQLEKINARNILDDADDPLIKGVEFLVQSAIFLMNVGQPDNWKLQLQAALSLLENR